MVTQTGGVNAADAPVVYDEDIVLGYIDEIDTTISTATTDLNEIVDSAEDYVDEAKTSCANDKQSCQTIKSEVETIAGNMGNPVTNITFENGNLVIEKVKGEPVKIKISSPLDAYPVGSFYFSQSSTSPATLFGGTWEQLEQGRVLLSQGTNYPAGSTGGEATHTLTVAEMPNIYGEFPCVVPANHSSYTKGNFYGTNYIGATNSAGQTISMPTSNTRSDNAWGYGLNIGENKSHNNLQPYISVYIWKRIS